MRRVSVPKKCSLCIIPFSINPSNALLVRTLLFVSNTLANLILGDRNWRILEAAQVHKDLNPYSLANPQRKRRKSFKQTCDSVKGLRKHRHTLTHDTTKVWNYSPVSVAEKSFNRAELFSGHSSTVPGTTSSPKKVRERPLQYSEQPSCFATSCCRCPDQQDCRNIASGDDGGRKEQDIIVPMHARPRSHRICPHQAWFSLTTLPPTPCYRTTNFFVLPAMLGHQTLLRSADGTAHSSPSAHPLDVIFSFPNP